MDSYSAKITRTRAAYKEARDRFEARLRGAPEADVHRAPADGGWSAAQIGWPVAAVDAAFAAMLSGESPAVKPLPDSETARTWDQIVAEMPAKIEAPRRVQPPGEVRRDDVLASLAESARKLDAALAALPEARAAGF